MCADQNIEGKMKSKFLKVRLAIRISSNTDNREIVSERSRVVKSGPKIRGFRSHGAEFIRVQSPVGPKYGDPAGVRNRARLDYQGFANLLNQTNLRPNRGFERILINDLPQGGYPTNYGRNLSAFRSRPTGRLALLAYLLRTIQPPIWFLESR